MTPILDQRPPLEAQLIDLVDEIAYNTADLDDGYEAKLLTVAQICKGVPLFDRFYRRFERELHVLLWKDQRSLEM